MIAVVVLPFYSPVPRVLYHKLDGFRGCRTVLSLCSGCSNAQLARGNCALEKAEARLLHVNSRSREAKEQ